MKFIVYVIQDKIAEESSPLWEAKNLGVASRRFLTAIKESETPEDFRLLEIGEMDHETNVLSLNDPVIDVTDNVQVMVDGENIMIQDGEK
jgi:hypothetical protein